MKKAKEIYKDEVEEYDYWYDYQPLLGEFGKILIQVDDKDYQGDSRLLYESNNKYGYLIFGWGSCSGCDSLQACGDIEDVQKLMDELFNSIKWFNSLEEIQTYFKNKDWELEYCYHESETKDFINKVINYEK